MGKSDTFLFQIYQDFLKRHLPDTKIERIALLGFSHENAFTRGLPQSERDLYDIQLGNWDIKKDWTLTRADYDMIVCTRCAYFTDPGGFIERCMAHLRPGGIAFVDWGLGDHWRFPEFRVGWIGPGEAIHEYAIYDGTKQYLEGAVWSRSLESQPASMQFRDLIRIYGYNDARTLGQIIEDEVDRYMDLDVLGSSLIASESVCLWPESPQLYILTLLQRPG